MKCPVCKDVTLLMSEKQGVEIDYCPECRGIWLDRGELEKLLEKEQSYNQNHYHHEEDYHKHHDYDHHKHYDKEYKDHKHYEDDYYKNHKYGKKKKKEGFMGEIFDIFGD